MYRKCVTEISVQHQRQIAQTLLTLMEKTPYEEITVTALCEAAGVSRRIFYHLFNSRADALHALVDLAIQEAESYRADLPNEMVRFFYYWREQKPLLDALTQNNLTNVLWERMLQTVLQEDYEMRHWLRGSDSDEGEDILLFSLSGIMGITYGWYRREYDRSPEEMARVIQRLLTKPLTANNEKTP